VHGEALRTDCIVRMADVAPCQSVYVSNLNEKVNKQGVQDSSLTSPSRLSHNCPPCTISRPAPQSRHHFGVSDTVPSLAVCVCVLDDDERIRG
jgi:hypothetical protein